MDKLNEEKIQDLISPDWKFIKILGQGSFGLVIKAKHVENKNTVAIKIEDCHQKRPQLVYESKIYKLLQSYLGFAHYYKIFTCQGYNFLVIGLLGKNLNHLFTKMNHKFSLKTVLMLGIQMLQRLQNLHEQGFVHRDLKPENFAMGRKEYAHILYLLDFGLTKSFTDPKSAKHVKYKENNHLTGTARYVSINTHTGIEQSRRDDLESLGYILIYFLRGQLPWQNLPGTDKKVKYKMIMQKKIDFFNTLAQDLLSEFYEYFRYCSKLSFDETPNYDYLRGLFQRRLQKECFEFDYQYDWSE